MEKPREIAAGILLQRQKGAFVENLLDSTLADIELKPEDRRFVQELVYGVVRWELTLDWLISEKSGGKPQKEIVQILLRLALYQMFWLERVPSYAAVNESVEICKRYGFEPQSKFVNAVLRNYGREADLTRRRLDDLSARKPWLGGSHPEWLFKRWEKQWGSQKTVRLLEWNNSPPPTYARVNTLTTDAESLRKRWTEEGVVFESTDWHWALAGTTFLLKSHPPLSKLASFQKGYFYIQDPSTLLAPMMMDPQPGENILDICAAPGGKTTFIAQLMNNQGRIVAQDIEPERLKMVEENAARLAATSICTEGQGLDPSTFFDRVLVDAPCSNTGVLRRRVELRWRIRPEEITRLAITQSELLRRAAARLRPGGILVYSTCSLEREENQMVVGKFLGSNPEFRLESEQELTPMNDGVDGAYCARLKRLS